ncbi:MAG: twin-arginine translocation pathway signal [Xanthobacteraceae bacterium]|nr:MAG: twin-arginine translocation pathway signal [Xanthobacteraceae bacterium]
MTGAGDQDCGERPRIAGRAVILALALACAAVLSGCSGLSGTLLTDPGRYELYSCEQLARERKTVAAREDELRRLMNHAQDNSAGLLLAELGYGSDYAATRGQLQVAEAAWREKRCEGAPSAEPARSR